uniref:Uncharacterized protein n=1 Tax=Panagrolaimus sp. ES5 TaxID=591445 RepID=A0AC34GYL0_9BILA
MMKIVLIIAFCGFVLAYGEGYDASQAEASKSEGDGYKQDENVSGGQQENKNVPSDDEEINHEFSYSGKTINHPEPPPLPAPRLDGPAPASYPPLKLHEINSGSFSGKGGFENPKM